MSFTIRVRGAPHATELADYECPEHGRFEAAVARPAPDTAPCPERQESGECSFPCVRGFESPWRISAPGSVLVRRGEVVQGKVDAHPGDHYVMDTRPLADGMPLKEFKERRAKVHRDIVLKQMRKMTGR